MIPKNVINVNGFAGFISTITAGLYLLVYTPLKRVTWLNTLVGAIPGALPPLGGWAQRGAAAQRVLSETIARYGSHTKQHQGKSLAQGLYFLPGAVYVGVGVIDI